MKKYLLLFLVLSYTIGYSQKPIKIYKRIELNIKIWPDTNRQFGKWYIGETNGIQISFPSFESDKRIKILNYTIVEKHGNAQIIQDSELKNVFWIRPSTSIDNKKKTRSLSLNSG